MADFDACEDSHFLFQERNIPHQAKPTSRSSKGKFFCSNFGIRFLIIALFLLLFLLFPSEAPEFISHTVFAKSWELVHLLIIGIFVSYGLFGRRRTQTQMGIQSSPALHTPNMVHASTIFNFEHQNPCGYGSNSNGYRNVNVNRNQACEFPPYGLEPTVVVRPGDCDFDYEPLDLPVRSLKSRVDSDSEECANESEFEADGSGSSYSVSEEDKESENMERNLVDTSAVPWNWSNPAEELSYGINHEAEQASYGDLRPLSDQSSPFNSPSTESPTMERENSWRGNVEVENSWRKPTRVENASTSSSVPYVSGSMLVRTKEEVGNVSLTREYHDQEYVNSRPFRPSTSKGSSPMSSSLSESPHMERESSWRGNVEVENSWREPTRAENASPSSSVPSESGSVPVRTKEVGNVSLTREHHDQEYVNSRPFRPSTSKGSSPLSSSSSESPPMEVDSRRKSVERESSLMENTTVETMFFSSPASLKSRSMRMGFREACDVSSLVGTQDPKQHHPKSFRAPMEVENLKRENVEGESSFMENARVETTFFPSPTYLKSRSMRMDFKEEASNVPSFLGNQDPKLLHSKSFRSPKEMDNSRRENVEGENSLMESTRVETMFSSSPSSLKSRSKRMDFREKVSEVSTFADTQDPKLHRSKSSRSPISRSPMCNFMLPSLSKEVSPLCSVVPESPTIEMENLQREIKKVENSWKELSENHTSSPSFQDNDFSMKRAGPRSRRTRKRDDFCAYMQGSEKSRTDSLRSENSCDPPSSSNFTSVSTSSLDFASIIEPTSSRYTDGLSLDENVQRSPVPLVADNVVPKEVRNTEIEELESENMAYMANSPLNASRNDFVVSMESSSTQLGVDSSLSKEAGQSPTVLENGRKALSRTSHSRRFSCGSFFDRDLWKGSRDETKEITKKGKDDDAINSGKCGWDCLKLDVKPAITKGSVRGKSVRTVRPRVITSEPSCTSEISDKQKSDQNAAQVGASVQNARERQEVVIISIGISGKNARNASPMAGQSNNRNQKGGKRESIGCSSLELDKKKERSNGKMSVLENVNEDEDYTSEIDRKAGEFIAKFKEQIRLQKVGSRRESSKH